MSAKIYEMPNSTNTSLSEKEQKFLACLLATPTLEAACKRMRISHETGRLWLQRPHVKLAYDVACRDIFQTEMQRLQRVVSDAITLLVDTLTDDAASPTKVRAAQILLQASLEVNKISDLAIRVAELEARLSERKSS